MRIAHKVGVALIAIALMLLLLLIPRHGQGQSSGDFGDYTIYCSAISTSQIDDSVAKQYGIERSAKRGLLNVSVQRAATAQTAQADVNAEISDLLGHRTPLHLRDTKENGDVDYVADFPLSGSGTYRFTVKVTPQGRTQPYVLTFNQDYVVD